MAHIIFPPESTALEKLAYLCTPENGSEGIHSLILSLVEGLETNAHKEGTHTHTHTHTADKMNELDLYIATPTSFKTNVD